VTLNVINIFKVKIGKKSKFNMKCIKAICIFMKRQLGNYSWLFVCKIM